MSVLDYIRRHQARAARASPGAPISALNSGSPCMRCSCGCAMSVLNVAWAFWKRLASRLCARLFGPTTHVPLDCRATTWRMAALACLSVCSGAIWGSPPPPLLFQPALSPGSKRHWPAQDVGSQGFSPMHWPYLRPALHQTPPVLQANGVELLPCVASDDASTSAASLFCVCLPLQADVWQQPRHKQGPALPGGRESHHSIGHGRPQGPVLLCGALLPSSPCKRSCVSQARVCSLACLPHACCVGVLPAYPTCSAQLHVQRCVLNDAL